jgi:peptidyl-prolyl cis-trans isomerase SurA
MNKLAVLACSISISLSFAFPSQAASIYSPIYQVNESVITKYELDQRIKMLRAFGTTGDLNKLGTDQLIEDRLRLQAAKQAGITVTDEEIFGGMEEFAARGNFSAEQLLTYFRQRGVHRETFEDFVRAGLLWRNVIGARFASKVNVSDEEVDATLDVNAINFPKTVNIAEIVLPTSERGPQQTRALADRLAQNLKTSVQFSIAAKKFSKSDTAKRGGDMGWIPLGTLPANVSSRLNDLEINQVTAPITVGSAVVLYQLRGVREAKSAGEQVISVSYLQVAMPNAKSGQAGQIAAAQKLINSGDTCLDMQANASGFGEDAISSQSLPAAQVPARIGVEIAKLDPNEAGYFVAENGSINVVMLCNRAKDLPEGAREQIRSALFNRRVGSFGAGYLQELRGDAIIIAK